MAPAGLHPGKDIVVFLGENAPKIASVYPSYLESFGLDNHQIPQLISIRQEEKLENWE